MIQEKAFSLIYKVLTERAFCNVLIALMHQEPTISSVDKDDIDLLVIGTFKYQIYLKDMIVQNYRDWEKLSLENKIWAEMSLYQILFMPHLPLEQILETFNKHVSDPGQLALMFKDLYENNASKKRPAKRLVFIKDEQKCINYSFPLPLYRVLNQQYGRRVDDQVLADNIKWPVISFRVNTLKTTADEVLKNKTYSDYKFKISELCPDGIISQKQIFDTELYNQGQIIRQDQASMLVSQILNPSPYDVVLDMCAGIGTKTGHIAALMHNKGKIIACDNDGIKLDVAKTYLERLGVNNTQTICQDALHLDSSHKFTRILIDAPSSAFGLIKRKPELKMRKWTKEELEALVALQAKLLDKAYLLLEPGGVIVYCTTTFNLNENQRQIEDFLNRHGKQLIVIEERQIFGYKEHTDGVYICKLKKE